MVYLLLVFPDGMLPSPGWRPAMWLTHLTAAATLVQTITPYTSADKTLTNPIGVRGLGGTVLSDNQLGFILLPFAIVAGVASVVVRFRSSSGDQRQQLKWVALAGAFVAVGYLFQNLTWLLGSSLGAGLAAVGLLVLVACFTAVPIASGLAVLRHDRCRRDPAHRRQAGSMHRVDPRLEGPPYRSAAGKCVLPSAKRGWCGGA